MLGGVNPNAWRNWYHAVGSTYGTWLRGDPRGFRTFRHRLHVDGDYHRPPPLGIFAPLFERSRQRMRFAPVALSPAQQRLLCDAMVERLRADHSQVIALAVAVNHFHLLARFPPPDGGTVRQYDKSILHDGRDPAPRHYLGLARKHASEVLKVHGMKPPSPVWATRPRLDPIRDRAHQVNVARYIIGHLEQGAVVYRFDKGIVLP